VEILEEKIKNREILELLAKNMKHFRTLNNISQTELGLRAGITPSYITDIERCRHDVLLSTVSSIASGLGVSPYELFVDNREIYYSKSRIDKIWV